MENICEWENCKENGKFKAPLERDNSKNYKWLCERTHKIISIKIGIILKECLKKKLKIF